MAHLFDTWRARSNRLPRDLSALRQRGAQLGRDVDRRAVWQRAKATVGAFWRPRRGDASLPNWLHLLVGASDDGIRIPGTRVRLGLDAVLGTLLPGAGDAFGGVTSAAIMLVAWRRGAPAPLLWRMLGNAVMDIGVGAIPIVGDIFDLGFHANRRNLTLLEDHLSARSQARRASQLSLVLIIGVLITLMLLMLAAGVGLVVFSWEKLR